MVLRLAKGSSGLDAARELHARLFFFNDTATTEIYTLSLHDALPISCSARRNASSTSPASCTATGSRFVSARMRGMKRDPVRSEEHTSELQSHLNFVCRLLLEKCLSNGPAPRERQQRIGCCA